MNRMILNELKDFDIVLDDESIMEIKITDLLNEEKCLSFLQKQMTEIQAPNLSVAASMFSKRYAYLVVSSTLYCMAEFNCVLNFPVSACTLSKERKLCIQEDRCKWQEVRNMTREHWRENVLRNLFSSHITPVLDILKKTSRISSAILWENIATRINSIYEKTLAKELNRDKIERLNSDFNYLENASGELFNLNENPLKRYLKIGEELKTNPSRRTCCMYYKLMKNLEEISHCGNCPIRSKQI
ncbi:IucA/IucC family C-terminal-domain containing protein [Bacillus sp. B15-48]|uniref:IucA/IucC family C-terminal-domain containing protein n=1 Tax=Bacillus sp. B15-48 TaxID=1548601 RepID=UPI00193F15C7|nr:IucA/IucC family C-terminal-domain containing protein [Bacillus sp. B15-48]MBM4765272.1 Fe-S oxidoreductase [Bacillus sp. B15-48]